MAEDSVPDIRLIEEALAHHAIDAEMQVHRDGEAMIQWIARMDEREVPCPDIVLLDLNLPRHDGIAILERIRQSPVCANVPVVIVTSSNAARDRANAARLGVTQYFRKPIDYDEFLHLGAIVRQVLSAGSTVD